MSGYQVLEEEYMLCNDTSPGRASSLKAGKYS